MYSDKRGKMSPLIAMNPPTHLSMFNCNINFLIGYIYNFKRKSFFQSKLNVFTHTIYIYVYVYIWYYMYHSRNELVYILCTIAETNMCVYIYIYIIHVHIHSISYNLRILVSLQFHLPRLPFLFPNCYQL